MPFIKRAETRVVAVVNVSVSVFARIVVVAENWAEVNVVVVSSGAELAVEV